MTCWCPEPGGEADRRVLGWVRDGVGPVAGSERVFDTGPMAVPVPDLAALRGLGDRVRPLALAGERLLAVPDVLAPLLPQGGLQRGAGWPRVDRGAPSWRWRWPGRSPSAGPGWRSWAWPTWGCSRRPNWGSTSNGCCWWPTPSRGRWATVVEALLDAVDLVLVRPPGPVAPGIQRRLAARARDRGSVLVQVGGAAGAWAEAPDLVVASGDARWVGLGDGHGHLRARRVRVTVAGRRAAHRPRSADVWLPGAPMARSARVDDAVRTRSIGLVDDAGTDHPDVVHPGVDHRVTSEAG